MYIDIDKAVAQALSLRVGLLEKRLEKLEVPRVTDSVEGSQDFPSLCKKTGFSERQIQGHSRVGVLQDARYEVCRSLLRGGLTIREVSRVMRRSTRSIQRMS